MDETKNSIVNPSSGGQTPAPMPSPMPRPGSTPASKPDELVYSVMPQEGKAFTLNVDSSRNSNSMGSAPVPDGTGSSSRKWIYIILGLIVILGLAGLAYYLLGSGSKSTETPAPVVTSKLTKEWLSKYFNSGTCTDQSACGDAADPDKDGLTNVAEFDAKTIPLNPDTDNDGLADGDEVKIYQTDPTLKYTDRREIVATNDWSDGYQIKNGYDPVTGQKMTDARVAQIKADTAKFKIHEPSSATTAKTDVSVDTSTWKVYTNSQWKLEFKYPSDWTALADSSYIDVAPKNVTGLNSYLMINLKSPSNPETAFAGYKKLYADTVVTEKTSTFASLPATEYKFSSKDPNVNNTVFLLVNNNNKYLEIRNNKVDNQVVAQILSTFKFATATSQTPTPAPAPVPPPAAAPKTMNLMIQNSAFGSGTLNVNKGDTVTWMNMDTFPHTVVSDSGAFTSPSLATNQVFMYTFNTAGTFAYHCSIHPNMKATIVVK